MTIYISICALLFVCIPTQPGECSPKQTIFRRKVGKYLANHVKETKQAGSELECGMLCVADGSCQSVNYKTAGIGKGLCELNSKTLQEASEDYEETNLEFNHLHVIKKVRKLNIILYCCTAREQESSSLNVACILYLSFLHAVRHSSSFQFVSGRKWVSRTIFQIFRVSHCLSEWPLYTVDHILFH
jgi:hypothetical protein